MLWNSNFSEPKDFLRDSWPQHVLYYLAYIKWMHKIMHMHAYAQVVFL